MIILRRNPTVAVALGGGGARGLAHLGVIEALRELPIDIKRLVGVSIGGLAGALCAVEDDSGKTNKLVLDYLTSDTFQTKQAALFSTAPDAEEPVTAGLFAWYYQIRKFIGVRRKLAALFSKPALLDADVLQDVVDALIPDVDIRDTTTPLSIVALDLYSGRKVVLTEGSLKTAVMASAAIPGVFPPVKWDSMLLCDVGLMDAIPTDITRSYKMDLTIAVDVGANVEPITECKTAADIFLRLSDLGEPIVRNYTSRIADLMIRPAVADINWYDFSDPRKLVEAGRAAVRTQCVADFLLNYDACLDNAETNAARGRQSIGRNNLPPKQKSTNFYGETTST